MTVGVYTMNWLATPYREDRRLNQPTPVENLQRDGSTAQRTLFSPYSNRSGATQDFLGFTRAIASSQYYYPSRQVPNYHPDFEATPFSNSDVLKELNLPYLFADSIKHEGFLADIHTTKGATKDSEGGAVANYAETKMTVGYSSTPYVILTDDQLSLVTSFGPTVQTHEADVVQPDLFLYDPNLAPTLVDESCCLRYVWGKLVSAPKYQTLPAIDTLSWAINNVPVTTTAVIILCEGDLLLKWYNIPQLLFDRELMESVIGKTNSDDFGHPLSPIGFYKKNTLVFVSPDVEPFRRATGEIYFDITYRFKYYPNGANKFYYVGAPNTGMTVSGGGPEIAAGPGFYLATRPFNFANPGQPGGRAVPEDQLSSLPAGTNVLLFPQGDFSNLFRARVDQTDTTLLD